MVGRSGAASKVAALGLAALVWAGCTLQAPAQAAAPTKSPAPTPAALPRLLGDGAAIEGGASLRAQDADSRLVVWMVGHGGSTSFLAAGGDRLTGAANALNRPAILDAISTRPGVTVVRTEAGTSKSLVTIDEPNIAGRLLVERLAASSDAKGVVVSQDARLPDLSVSLRDVPSDAALTAFAKVTGTRIVRGRDLLFVLPKDTALVDLPKKKPDPSFALRSGGANASQLVALLESVGIKVEGRVPCAVGSAVWIDATQVRSDEAMRAIRLAAGAGDQIGNGDACKPLPWTGDAAALANASPLALVRTPKKTAALVLQGSETYLVSPLKGDLPNTWMPPAAAARAVTVVAGSLDLPETAKLRATFVDVRGRSALIESEGALFYVTSPIWEETPILEIADGRVALAKGERELALPVTEASRRAAPVGNVELRGRLAGGAAGVDEIGKEEDGTASSSDTKDFGNALASSPEESEQPGGGSGSGGKNVPPSPRPTPVTAMLFGQSSEPGPMAGPEANQPVPPMADTGEKKALPLWAVEPFSEKSGWLGAHQTSLGARFRGDSWGDTFAVALETALRQRGRRATAVSAKLTGGQTKVLVDQEGLRYIVAGDLRELTVDAARNGKLVVGVQIRSYTAGKMKTVDLRAYSATTKVAAPLATDAELLELFRRTADQAAEAVADSLPQDLFAVRN